MANYTTITIGKELREEMEKDKPETMPWHEYIRQMWKLSPEIGEETGDNLRERVEKLESQERVNGLDTDKVVTQEELDTLTAKIDAMELRETVTPEELEEIDAQTREDFKETLRRLNLLDGDTMRPVTEEALENL